jgi:Flp pilus assembly protein TadG
MMCGVTTFFRKWSAWLFARDQRGNVGLIFAFTIIPVIGAMAMAVDYSRGNAVKARLQAAADAAVLAAARDPNATTLAQRQRVADQVFLANIDTSIGLQSARLVLSETGSGLRARVDGSIPTEVMRVLGQREMNIGAVAEVMMISRNAEIALVLDNTGSMEEHMDELRDYAAEFVNTLMTGGGDNVKVAVVPYVASVNPGRAALGMSYMDTGAESAAHGRFFEKMFVGRLDNGCRMRWEGNSGGGGPQDDPNDRGNQGGDRRRGALDTPALPDPMKSFAGVVRELFGVRAAQAQTDRSPRSQGDVTPNTVAPLSGSPAPGSSAIVPTGFNFWDDCGLFNPERISHFDLFNRIPGAQWKGCVEARPYPFDVTDEAPSRANPDSLFVPYFWPDQTFPGNSDQGDGQGPYRNNYMRDGPLPSGWVFAGDWEREYTILKYNGVNRAMIRESGPNTLGPNSGCPDEILPLTASRDRVLAKVRSLAHWNAGGTISSEGLAWGWRVLSPGPPFTEGRPYGRDNRKVIVLMTDGMNALVEDNYRMSAHKSDYTAYGYLRRGQFPASERFDEATAMLDSRMREVCQNIQRHEIEVYTIIFNERDANARQLVRGCASSDAHFFVADNVGELRGAFRQIAGQLSRLRLTK